MRSTRSGLRPATTRSAIKWSSTARSTSPSGSTPATTRRRRCSTPGRPPGSCSVRCCPAITRRSSPGRRPAPIRRGRSAPVTGSATRCSTRACRTRPSGTTREYPRRASRATRPPHRGRRCTRSPVSPPAPRWPRLPLPCHKLRPAGLDAAGPGQRRTPLLLRGANRRRPHRERQRLTGIQVRLRLKILGGKLDCAVARRDEQGLAELDDLAY